jgi:phosphoribosylglycinamide formyltransferase 1
MKQPPRIAIFASGSGSNAQRISEFFTGSGLLEISVIYCNNPEAYVLERASLLGIPAVVFDRSTFYNSTSVLDDLKNRDIDWIVLAGFLWLIPAYILKAYPGRIVNIHPALLPAYGGKGMYGMKVHQAVIAAGDAESGITIHYVNEHYDEGNIIFQARCTVNKGDTSEMLAAKIHELEYKHFPVVIGKLVAGEFRVNS